MTTRGREVKLTEAQQMIQGYTKNERKFLSRRICAWCEMPLDWDNCQAIYEKCTPTIRDKRRRDCLQTYKPRPGRAALAQHKDGK